MKNFNLKNELYNDLFFTSDTHFFHKNIIKYCNRPFNSIEEMNSNLIQNWNKKISNKDIVFHLGDFCFDKQQIGNTKKILSVLNGKIILILGNHDNYNICKKENFYRIEKYLEINIDGKLIVLFHYPIFSWNKKHYNSWHLYGHVHSKLNDFHRDQYCFDVGVDSWNYTPLSYEEIKTEMNKRENINEYKKRYITL